MIRTPRQQARFRSGFTKIDLLVLLGIVLLAFVLLPPTIFQRRICSRQLQCLSHMRNVGLAHLNYASSNNGNLANLTKSQAITNSDGLKGELLTAWPIMLLPALDATAQLRRLRETAVIESGHARIDESSRVHMEVFTCPDDPLAYRKPGRLSFVVNAGFISRNLYHGDPEQKHVPGSLRWTDNSVPIDESDVAIHIATGVVWNPSDAFQPSLEYVSGGDGTSTTILLTENLQAGNWYDTDSTRIGFGFPVANVDGKVPLGTGTTFESVEKPLNTQFTGNTLSKATPRDWWINTGSKQNQSQPRPSSEHDGGVNVIMCDGAGRFLNQDIDPHLYIKMMTSNGAAFGEGELE
jgi:hypothetical protein